MKHAVKHIHFVGVGGAGMSGIAEILHNLGYTVSGSDQSDSPTARRLAGLGIRVFTGHDAAHIAGAEAIVINASGCGAMIKDYAHLLRHDPRYADKAARVSALTRDLAQFLPAERERLQALCRSPDGGRGAHVGHGAQDGLERPRPPRLAFHPPCTLQHGQKLRGGVEQHMAALGFSVQTAHNEAHL